MQGDLAPCFFLQFLLFWTNLQCLQFFGLCQVVDFPQQPLFS